MAAAAVITLLASGSQAQSGTSDPVDVSNNGQIRQTITAVVDFGMEPELNVIFSTASAEAGPFREIERVKMLGSAGANSPYQWDPRKRVILDEADLWLRVSWTLAYKKNWDGTPQSFVLAVVGTGVLSA